MNGRHGWNKTQFAHNWFIIVGPANDPAGIKNMTNATLAFKQIYDSKSIFVGRGDNSGTASKELALWNGDRLHRARQQDTVRLVQVHRPGHAADPADGQRSSAATR